MTLCESGICLPMILSFSSNFGSRNLCSSTDEEYIYFFLITWELHIWVTQKTLRQITEVAHSLESLRSVDSVSVHMCLSGAV